MNTTIYKEWLIKEERFPYKGSFYEKAKFILSYAVLAPSSHNMQPWLFEIKENRIDVFADYKRGLPYSDRLNRELFKSIGCSIANLAIAASHFGFVPNLSYFPEDDIDGPVVSVELKNGKPNLSIDSLFPLITQRTTNRASYEKSQIEQSVILHVKNLIDDKRISVTFITKTNQVKQIATIAKHASEFAFKDAVFKDELSSWVRPNNTKKPDGMPLSGFGIPDMLSLKADIFIRRMPHFIQAKIDYDNFIHSPAVMVLFSQVDDHVSWMVAGKIYETVSLYLYSQNIATAPNAGIIEHDDSCNELKELLHISGYPVFLARLGYMKEKAPHTPRRSVEDVLLS